MFIFFPVNRRKGISYTMSCSEPGIYCISMMYKGELCLYVCIHGNQFEGDRTMKYTLNGQFQKKKTDVYFFNVSSPGERIFHNTFSG